MQVDQLLQTNCYKEEDNRETDVIVINLSDLVLQMDPLTMCMCLLDMLVSSQTMPCCWQWSSGLGSELLRCFVAWLFCVVLLCAPLMVCP